MKTTLRILKFVAIAVIIAIIGLICYVKFVLPNIAKAEDIRIESSPERIERGNYLANRIYVCMDCHSKRDWNKFSGPLMETTLGQGGEEFDQKLGFPGKYFARNITPFGIQDWTDGEILRAVSCGVSKKGSALFPVMPYLSYGQLDREDLYSIIAYIRTLSTIENIVPESKSDFPMNFIINTIPKKADFSKIPDKQNIVAYGKYIFLAASCNDCHTQLNKTKPVEGMELAGGFRFPLNTGGTVFSANITPDKQTGIGNWSEEAFLFRFKAYSDSSYKPIPVKNGDFNTVMPWMMYSKMESEDMKAIYAYIKTVKPIANLVTKFLPE